MPVCNSFGRGVDEVEFSSTPRRSFSLPRAPFNLSFFLSFPAPQSLFPKGSEKINILHGVFWKMRGIQTFL
jgi:hypothetical protein